ncbi:MAG: transposase [Fusobacterium sp.]|nr:transposase [Fusobacterium sp.]
MKKYSKYTKELKLKAVKLYLSSNISAVSIAKSLDIKSDTQIHNWVKKYNQLGEKVFDDKKVVKQYKSKKSKRLLSLKKENKILKIENEYLKKLYALQLEQINI